VSYTWRTEALSELRPDRRAVALQEAQRVWLDETPGMLPLVTPTEVASVGPIFPLVSAFLGWLAVFLSGSDTSGNALFGNLQVVAAHRLGLDPVLMAATNASGGVMGKMVSPQNISTGTSTTNLKGHEGRVLARTFWHSVALTFLLGVLVMVQQHVVPGVIPH